MGRLLGWQLCRAGAQVTLFDLDGQDGGGAAAFTAAGMLAPYSELESADTTVYRMGMRSLGLWPDLLAQLGGDPDFHQRGTLVVAHAPDRPDLLRFRQQVHGRSQPGPGQYQILDRAGLAELEPELGGRFDGAEFLPEESWLAPARVMAALALALREAGVSWFESCAVEAMSRSTVLAGGRHHHFDRVIDCRGLGARADLPSLRGVRGEIIELEAPEVDIGHMVRLMHPRYRLYLVPRRDRVYAVGATQIESDDRGPITVRSALELLSAAYSLHAGFAEARVLGTRVNCRPALPDNLPAIVVDEGVIRVNGLFRHGFLLAPVLVEEVLAHPALGGAGAMRFPELMREGLAQA
jgi:glycine oxidase